MITSCQNGNRNNETPDFEGGIVISRSSDKNNAQKANQQLNGEFYKEENSSMADTKTEDANKKINEELESGKPSKGVDPDNYLANSENSLVTKGIQKKK
ncbi:hypothetical protein ACQCVP_02195 [Rossellomorea vietnamensis]